VLPYVTGLTANGKMVLWEDPRATRWQVRIYDRGWRAAGTYNTYGDAEAEVIGGLR